MAKRDIPSRATLLAATGKTVPDLIAFNLRILFCGINPGLYSGVTGYHFARPGNRFWPTLYAAGFTERRLLPEEEHLLLERGYGITNLVERATATANELSAVELLVGGQQLVATAQQYRPRAIAILGVSAYRAAFARPKAVIGPQAELIGESLVWVLPNPSGLNAHYSAADLARVYRDFRIEVGGGIHSIK